MKSITEDLFLENEKRLHAAFVQHGITGVYVDFDGSGDSGQIDNVSIEKDGASGGEDLVVTVWESGGSVFNEKERRWEDGQPREVEKTLRDAVEQHVHDALDDCGVDWYNDDGGYGHWRWMPDTGLDFEVWQRYTESNLGHSEERQLGEEA